MADLQGRLSAALGERYAIQSEIGRGGMATVSLAEDRIRSSQTYSSYQPPGASLRGLRTFPALIHGQAGLRMDARLHTYRRVRRVTSRSTSGPCFVTVWTIPGAIRFS